MKPIKLYHCTTNKRAKLYRINGFIKSPVKGFDTLMGALAWCVKTGRRIIYEINLLQESENIAHKLPDHHNKFGLAWWIDKDVKTFKCVFSADSDG